MHRYLTILLAALAFGVGCGGDDDTSALRTQVAALQTQIAQPTATPTPTATPSPTLAPAATTIPPTPTVPPPLTPEHTPYFAREGRTDANDLSFRETDAARRKVTHDQRPGS